MKIKFFILILIISFSCSDNQGIRNSYKNGNLKNIIYYSEESGQKDSIYEFYDSKNRKIKKIYIYKDTIVSTFYENGELFKKGRLSNNMQIGEWNYYNKNGFLSDKRKYMIIENKSVLNQILFINEKGNTVKIGSDNFNIYEQEEFKKEELKNKRSRYMNILPSKDTIKEGEIFKAILNYYTPIYKNSNSKIRVYIGDGAFKLNPDFSKIGSFSNIFESLSNDTLNQKWYPNASEFYNHMSIFGQYYKAAGKKFLKGFMIEVVKDSLGKEKIVDKMYFKIPVYVREK